MRLEGDAGHPVSFFAHVGRIAGKRHFKVRVQVETGFKGMQPLAFDPVPDLNPRPFPPDAAEGCRFAVQATIAVMRPFEQITSSRGYLKNSGLSPTLGVHNDAPPTPRTDSARQWSADCARDCPGCIAGCRRLHIDSSRNRQ